MQQLYLTTPGKARKNIAAISSRPGACYYISSDYSTFVKLRQLSRGKIVNLAGCFQRIFHNHREEFIDSLSRLNRLNDSFAWWGSRVASKSTTGSPLVQNITYLLCVEYLLQPGESTTLTLIVDSPALAAGIQDLAQERNCKVCSDLSPLWRYMRRLKRTVVNGAYLVWFIIKSAGDKLVSLRYGKEIGDRPSGHKRVVIRSWVMPGSFDSRGRYIDRNFGDLPDWLARRNTDVLFLPMFYSQAILSPRLAAGLARQKELFLLPGRYLKLIDYLHMIRDVFRIKRVQDFDFRIGGLRVSGLVTEVLQEEAYPLAAFDMNAYMCKRIKVRSGEIDTIYYPFEGNPPEKKFLLKCRQHFKGARIVGFQHTAYYKNLLTVSLGSPERDCHPIPDVIISSGRIYNNLLEEAGFRPETIVPGANLRYQDVFTTKPERGYRVSKQKDLLLPLTYSYDLAYELIDQTARAIRNMDAYRIRIRNHPLLSKRAIINFLKRIGLKDYAFADGGTIYKWFSKSHAVISAGGSITILEAMIDGIPVVRLMPANTVYLDPYAQDGYPLMPVNTAAGLRAQLDKTAALLAKDPGAFSKFAPKILADYYTKPDSNSRTVFFDTAESVN